MVAATAVRTGYLVIRFDNDGVADPEGPLRLHSGIDNDTEAIAALNRIREVFFDGDGDILQLVSIGEDGLVNRQVASYS
jgi:hypothetical protein